ncbi:response regulator [Thermodesulforhabdus norvegica]|uniref:Response regulator receiver domain-containing protein n=1 Tax=Thermodesulforhabdus norvegica TaxID=39841 RepID=A0A1I4SX01_9BACT|nr:response regulator [Thermodesulforhabdus norvegica]SFM68925.1 Response regulator receiver domain-containing protein [Thermodesulforhabdus norvegica]
MDVRQKTTILVLDDEPIVCKRLKPYLEKNGYEVEVFTDSSKAMERVMEKDFDIVITDLKMEGIDGMTFLTRVKEKSPATQVIVITGFATMETARQSFQKGVFDFIAKPFKLSEIYEIVRRAEKKLRQEALQDTGA